MQQWAQIYSRLHASESLSEVITIFFSLYPVRERRVRAHHIYIHLVGNAKKPTILSWLSQAYLPCTFQGISAARSRCSWSEQADGRHGGGKIHKSRAAPDVLVYLWNSQHFVVRSQLPRPNKLACRWWTRVTGHRSNLRRRPSEESDFLPKFLSPGFSRNCEISSKKWGLAGDEKISLQRCTLTKGVLFPAGGIFTFIFQASCIFALDNRRLRRESGPLVESAALHSYILTINSRFIVSRLKHTALTHSQVQLPILLSFHERVLAARGSKIPIGCL